MQQVMIRLVWLTFSLPLTDLYKNVSYKFANIRGQRITTDESVGSDHVLSATRSEKTGQLTALGRASG